MDCMYIDLIYFQMAENIAALIDGYYRLFTTSDICVWDKTPPPKTPSSSVTNSLEKRERAGRDGGEGGEGVRGRPVLNEDYSEIGLGEDEADYSTPASK